MSVAGWFLVVGAVMAVMAMTAAHVRRFSISSSMVYLAAGIALGPAGFAVFHFNPIARSGLFEVLTEIGVIISVFVAGLKLAAPLGNRSWWKPFRLATVTMVISIALVAMFGMGFLGLSLGAAVLLGAILAPTDPVLASDVQVKDIRDPSTLRFSLTGEAGLNDGTAFPFVMLGLGLLGAHELGDHYLRWLGVDVIWATTAGLAVGGLLGALFAWIIAHLHRRGLSSAFTEDFSGLALIAIAYGAALLLKSYGFLAVFAAGYMLHRTEHHLCATEDETDERDPHMTLVSLRFIQPLERLGEVGLIILMGGMLFADSWPVHYLLLAACLFFVIRPVAVQLGMLGSGIHRRDRWLMSWFGIRGIGSLYYLAYALQHGLDGPDAVVLTSATLVVVTTSIVLHGVTVIPLTRRFSDD
ncbi:sodium:proton antiporter [Marinihelvus fidelis]|uniref:Sodium:proton antiporter n=1 Tax=Marinihelvus fidelis TaxID=2613842 RepID=A0A5N0TG80_9GAMM|nr:sodium:proton antiporter [Marinihelvus fidelis]KAA9134050.1 sodium:proton antiporter [Marinihelvus fidelis]